MTCFSSFDLLKIQTADLILMNFFLISEILLHFLDVGLKLALDEMFQRQRKSLSFSHLYIYMFASALLLISFCCCPIPPPALGECPNTLQQNKEILYLNGTWIYGTNNSTATFTNFSKNTALTPWRGGIWKNDHIQEKKQKTH